MITAETSMPLPDTRAERLTVIGQQIPREGFRPNVATREALWDIEVEAVLGPAGAGKDTLFTMIQDDRRLSRIMSETSRPPRPSETPGAFFARHFDLEVNEDYAELYSRLRDGAFAQAIIHAKTGEFYGSSLPQYQEAKARRRRPIMSLQAAEFHSLKDQSRFKNLGGTMIVVEDFDDYIDNRWGGREEPTPERSEEAFTCLCIGLGTQGMRYIINGDKDRAAEDLRIALTSPYFSEAMYAKGRAIAETMLKGFVTSGLFDVNAARDNFVATYGRRYRLPEAAL